MTSRSRPDAVRDLIAHRFDQLGASPRTHLTESLLIKASRYCGHRYCRDGFQAIWFVEEDQIKIHGPAGELLETFPANAEMRQDRRYAA